MNDPICRAPFCKKPATDAGYCAKHKTRFIAEPIKRPAPAQKPPSASAQMVCPHCQTKGSVTTKQVKQKQGISGGKATGAVLTAGFSVLATGLSKIGLVTEAHCGNCGVTWHIA